MDGLASITCRVGEAGLNAAGNNPMHASCGSRVFQWPHHSPQPRDWCRSCLAEPRALILRPRPPGGLEPPEPKVRRLGGSSPPSLLYDAASR